MVKSKKLRIIKSISLIVCAMAFSSMSYSKNFYQVVTTAIKSNPEVLRAQANTNAEFHGIKEARGEYLPSVDLTAGYGKERTEREGTADINLYRTERAVKLEQLLFDGFGVNARYKSRKARYRSAAYLLDETKEKIAQRAIAAYIDAVKTREIAILAKANEEEHHQTLAKVMELYKGGAGRKGDISLAEGRLAQTQASVARLRNSVDDANAAYLNVIGEKLTYKISWPQVPTTHLPKSLKEAIKIGVKNSPLLKSRYQDMISAKYTISDINSSFYPKIFIELGASSNKNLDGVKGYARDNYAMVKAEWNILNGGSDIARRNQATFRKAESNEIFAFEKREIIRDITFAWNQYITSKKRLNLLQEHMVSAAEVLVTYQEQYKYGQRQLFNLLDQANEVFDSKATYVEGRDELLRNSHNLLRSMGLLVSYIHSASKKKA